MLENMFIVHTSKSENRALDLWEDFVSEFPSYRGACRFVNISHVRCPSSLPKLILIVLEDDERLTCDCERRLNELVHGWIFKDTKFLFVSPTFNWRIPACDRKMEIAAAFPLSIWRADWMDILHEQLSTLCYQPNLG